MTNQTKHTGWLAWFARNPVAANLLMITLLAVGLINAINMRTEGFPPNVPNQVSISVNFEGGSPEVVEESVAAKIEEALQGVSGIKDISSTVTSNHATILVQGIDTYPIDVLKDDIKIRVDSISTFSEEVQNIVITQQEDSRPVIYVQIHGDTDHKTLKEVAIRIRDRLLELSTVNKIDTRGMREYEITIEVDEEKLRTYQLSFEEVAVAIQNASLNVSAGELKSSGGVIAIQGRHQRYNRKEFSSIVVRNSDKGGLVLLNDIAIVDDGFTDAAILSEFDGHDSINLDVQLIGDDSITKASTAVKQLINEIENEGWLPYNIEITTWSDEAENIRNSLSILSLNGLIGMGLVLIVLALFLNIKVAFFVAIGIPVSFAGALMVMGPSYLNYSLNELTTFAFIIVLGIVVDDAIVIGENIYSHKKRFGGSVETAIHAAKEVATPATFGVLTTVAAFYPLTTITGSFGGPFRIIAVVVILCLLFSLIESKLILPAHMGKMKFDEVGTKKQNILERYWDKLQSLIDKKSTYFIQHRYKKLVSVTVKYRYQSLGIFIALFILSIGLITSGFVRSVFVVEWQANVIYADITMVTGTPTDEIHQKTRDITDGLIQIGEDLQYEYEMDINPVKYAYAYSKGDESVQITVELIASNMRNFSSNLVLARWREYTKQISGIKHKKFYAGYQAGDDLLLEITSSDNDIAKQVAIELQNKMASYIGVFDIASNLDNQRPEFTINLTPEAYLLNLSESDVLNQLRSAIFGYEAQRVQRGDEELRVKVRYPEAERNSINDLEQIRIRTPDDGTVPLNNVATLIYSSKQSTISRKNGKRIFEVKASANKDITSPSEVLTDLRNNVFPELLRNYPGVNIHIGGDGKTQSDAIGKLLSGFVLGLLIIYALLAIPLKSYTKPIVIMLCIPFGIIGAIWGHLIIGLPISLLSFFGILALSGVVVNDSLVLVSRYNQQREQGQPYEIAAVDAGITRFRAVILTSITTFSGLFPLILESAEQAQILIPMAVSLAFGILFATAITLLIVPVLLGIHEDIKQLFISRDIVLDTN